MRRRFSIDERRMRCSGYYAVHAEFFRICHQTVYLTRKSMSKVVVLPKDVSSSKATHLVPCFVSFKTCSLNQGAFGDTPSSPFSVQTFNLPVHTVRTASAPPKPILPLNDHPMQTPYISDSVP
ncbi:hypothetical protein BDN72DRAFT_643466 [Pluteus cervinus]|uniref:Uncharacterized protein n=1 Tax=Pluteus cervinus TaxID=181527 RepID=A0ACD3A0A1_9AGAR|nr:hypothetical protein BDN72DRAFT_643466 [Pluteus cervinus]